MIAKSFQLSIDKFVAVLDFMELEDVDSAEVECILANLIYQVGNYTDHVTREEQSFCVGLAIDL